MFITFEGLDFSGKSTQATILVEKLKKTHSVVHFLREPGGTKISERIRDILLDKKNLEMTEAAELFLNDPFRKTQDPPCSLLWFSKDRATYLSKAQRNGAAA